MEEEVPDFIQERDVFGQIKPKLSIPEMQEQLGPKMQLDVKYAGLGIRIGAFLLDTLIMFLPAFIIIGIPAVADDDLANHRLRYDLLSVLIFTLYYGFTESSDKQSSFGKRILHLKVISDNGDKLSFKKAAYRYLSKALSVIPFGFGIWAIASDKKCQAWHDMLMDTYVIYDK